MPIHDYRCGACGQQFELLVRGGSAPACPHCGATTLERLLSLTAPQGSSKAIIASARRAADKEGHFSHYASSERARLRR